LLTLLFLTDEGEIMSQDLGALKEQYKKLGEEITKLEEQKKLEERIRLKKPVPGSGSKFYVPNQIGAGVSESYAHAVAANTYKGFCSTSREQMEAFKDAFLVMAELRCQPGIIRPNQHPRVHQWTLKYNCVTNTVSPDTFVDVGFQTVGPVFQDKDSIVAAIAAVGEARIIRAYGTLMFMSPESRGELEVV
jgi:hypothetical protein